jgi:HEAT repeat protein
VPALGELAEAVQDVARGRDDPPRRLLRLLGVVRHLQAALAETGVGIGALEPLEPCGPWETDVPVVRLFFVLDGLSGRPGRGADTFLREAEEQGPLSDLRFLGPLLAAVRNHRANYHAEQHTLPAFGRAVLPDLRRLDPHGGGGEMTLLGALCRIDPDEGKEHCLRLIRCSSEPLLRAALGDLPKSVSPEEITAALRERLSGPQDDSWEDALAELAHRGRPTPADIPLVRPVLRHPDALTRAYAAAVLGVIGPAAADTVPDLRRALATLNYGGTSVTLILEALGRIGPAARAALPDVERYVTYREGQYREEAVLALARIDGPGRATELLRAKDHKVRSDAALALGHLGGAAEPDLPALVAALRDGARGVRFAAALSLARLGRPNPQVMGLLLDGLASKDYCPRSDAIEVLGPLGRRARKAIPLLKRIAEGSDPVLSRKAKAALLTIRGQP